MAKRGIFNLDFIQLNKKVYKAFLYDLLFYISIAIGFVVGGLFLKSKTEILETLDYSALFTTNINELSSILETLKQVFFWVIFTIFLFTLFSILMITIFKGLIWMKLRDKEYTLKFFWKYLGLNLVYFLVSAILIINLYIRFQDKLLTLFLIAVVIHFHIMISYLLPEKMKVLKTLGLAFKFGTINLGPILISYVVIFLAYLILSFILSVIPFYSLKPVINFLILLLFVSVMRNYLKENLDLIK